MRRAPWVIAAFLVAGACGPKTAPAPPRPPPGKGDVLRFKATKGDEPKASIKLVVEQEAGTVQGAKKGAGHVAFTIAFIEEEKVDVIGPDGSAQISSRLVDAVGTPGAGFKQEVVDELALAFDELKIQFKRSTRGEVTDLNFTGLKKPLDENTARAVFNAVYLAGRGPILPERPVESGGTWDISTRLPPETKLEGTVVYKYTDKNKEGAFVLIACEGSIDAKGAAGAPLQSMTAKSTTDLKFDAAAGQLVVNIFDGTTQTEQTQGPQSLTIKQHIHVEWIAQAQPATK